MNTVLGTVFVRVAYNTAGSVDRPVVAGCRGTRCDSELRRCLDGRGHTSVFPGYNPA